MRRIEPPTASPIACADERDADHEASATTRPRATVGTVAATT